MSNYYAENKSKAFSAINVVPLIGVLAALLVVIMTSLPGLAQRYEMSTMGGCGGHTEFHKHVLGISVLSSGTITVDNKQTPIDALSEFTRNSIKHSNHSIIAEIDVATDANYQDVIYLLTTLRESGLDDSHIKILNNYE
jgi:biopolymer transport protein ExbD